MDASRLGHSCAPRLEDFSIPKIPVPGLDRARTLYMIVGHTQVDRIHRVLQLYSLPLM